MATSLDKNPNKSDFTFIKSLEIVLHVTGILLQECVEENLEGLMVDQLMEKVESGEDPEKLQHQVKDYLGEICNIKKEDAWELDVSLDQTI